MYLATRSGVKLTGIKKKLVVSNKFSKPNSAWRFRLMCVFVDNLISSAPKDVRYDTSSSVISVNLSDYFLACKNLAPDPI